MRIRLILATPSVLRGGMWEARSHLQTQNRRDMTGGGSLTVEGLGGAIWEGWQSCARVPNLGTDLIISLDQYNNVDL